MRLNLIQILYYIMICVLHINISNIDLLPYVYLFWLTYDLFLLPRSSIHIQFWYLLEFVVRWKKQSFFVVFHLRHFRWHSLASLGIHNRRSIGRCDVCCITGFWCIIGIFLRVYLSIMLCFLMSITTWKVVRKINKNVWKNAVIHQLRCKSILRVITEGFQFVIFSSRH